MKSTTPVGPAIPEPALIFIPDISGFTQFVTDTEISHATHIIQELLNTILNANEIGLEVSEVEGDAILFYRFGKAPSSEELLAQVKRMFVQFHQHLKKYDTHRICNCGACKTAHDLSLKFIAHYGEITINQVQQFKKLFGKDVIVAHRLLKNDIDSHEYALFTENLAAASTDWTALAQKAWSDLSYAEQEYDSGRINYSYLAMGPLKSALPPLEPDDFSIPGHTTKMIQNEEVINAPLDLVFNVVTDLPWRSKWIPGTLPEVLELNSKLAQSGQTHKCLADGPVIVGHDYKMDTDKISFTETAKEKTHCTVYQLEKLGEGKTSVITSCYLPRNFFKQLMFSLFMKKKYNQVYQQSLTNLNNYCTSLVQGQKDHPYHIQIELSKEVPIAVGG